jgi:hypothetical protein
MSIVNTLEDSRNAEQLRFLKNSMQDVELSSAEKLDMLNALINSSIEIYGVVDIEQSRDLTAVLASGRGSEEEILLAKYVAALGIGLKDEDFSIIEGTAADDNTKKVVALLWRNTVLEYKTNSRVHESNSNIKPSKEYKGKEMRRVNPHWDRTFALPDQASQRALDAIAAHKKVKI